MSPTLDAALRSWPLDPWLPAALGAAAWLYLRGWRAYRRRDPVRWHAGHPAAFLGGLGAIFLALGSPVETFAGLLLQAHMVQHLLLMMVAPPLIWLGQPFLPLLGGLPRPVRAYWVAPLLAWRPGRAVFERLTHPLGAWLLFNGTVWVWHLPAAYELALRSPGWHSLQHACLLGAGLIFWYSVIRPFPSRPRWSAWLLIPYLLLADLSNTVLSALLTFSDRVLYAPYAEAPRLGAGSALDDQAAAGVLMWVPGSLAYLIPLFAVGTRLMFGAPASRTAPRPAAIPAPAPRRQVGRIPLDLIGPGPGGGGPPRSPRVDLLRVPVLGAFLRWRYARPAMQLPLLLLAAVVIADGLYGPQVAPMNLAGVLPWVHWRGLLILGLLAAGNLFCMACPFTLPRALARRVLPAKWEWPNRLRNKWLAVFLIALFLWAYESFSLWDSPWRTAWIALGYFAAAFAVDALFRGAAFCKYVCPVGQFNFVQSLSSPLEVRVRDRDVCSKCQTKDCVRGRDGIAGCALGLSQPGKSGNLDCTFCLDCARACPHANIGVVGVPPGGRVWEDAPRSGVGRLARRPDLAVLVTVLVFGAFANAAGMVAPVVEWQERLSLRLGQDSPVLTVSLFYLFALAVVPVFAIGAAAFVSRRWGRLRRGPLEVATSFAYALAPLGFGMWLAHYSFHFLTGYDAAAPAAQRFALDHGWALFGDPEWVCGCCRPTAGWLLRLEILFLDAGLLLSLYLGYRVALERAASAPRALGALAPWAVLMFLLFVAGVWILFQPMQMRGTMLTAG